MRMRLLPALLICTIMIACRAEPPRQPQAAPAPAPSPAPLAAPALPTPLPLDPNPAAQTPSAVFQTFVDVVRAGDHAQAWNLLTEESQAELGPSSEEFASRAFAGIKVRFGFTDPPRLALDEVVNPTLAVVAVTGRRTPQEIGAVASALVREEGVWKLALHGDLRVEAVSLGPAAVVLRAPQVTVERLWLDGQAVQPTREGDTYTVQITPGSAIVALLVRLPNGEPLGLAFPVKQ